MLGRLRWKVVGLMLLLLGFGGLSVLVFNVLIPLVHTALIPHTSPLVAPICPGLPECG
jgi:hypothetical protein